MTRQRREPERDSKGSLLITIPAPLASGAHQAGEEAQAFVYLVARALDIEGSGRVDVLPVARELRTTYRGGKIKRVIDHELGRRYWELEGATLRLRGVAAVVSSYPGDVAEWSGARTFPLCDLDSRPRRNAAFLAAVLAGHANPRSHAFIQRFSSVNRKTLSAWRKDPVIREHILVGLPAWATN